MLSLPSAEALIEHEHWVQLYPVAREFTSIDSWGRISQGRGFRTGVRGILTTFCDSVKVAEELVGTEVMTQLVQRHQSEQAFQHCQTRWRHRGRDP